MAGPESGLPLNLTVRQATDAERAEAASWPIWTCEPASFEWGYAETETCLILEGEAMIESRGRQQRLTAGDLAVFPKGLAARWNVLKAVRKHYRFG